ncbi:MAG: phosphotransferase [Hyphomonadaceae bacterium]|nr:phosphotransferase [Hyphomonadaceae bacterium]
MTVKTSQNEMFEATIIAMMRQSGFGNATRISLAQDASTRSYERLVDGDRSAILMKAPPGNEGANPPCPPHANEAERTRLGWNALSRLAASRVDAFVAIGAHLNAHGFSAPKVLAVDAEVGVAVIEDLGNDLYANVIEDQRADEIELYRVAGETLAALHAIAPPQTLASPLQPWPILDFDRIALRENANLFVEWTPSFLKRQALGAAEQSQWADIRDDLLDEIITQPRAFTLRDYHAENLLWLPAREGVGRVGLLDFQDSVHGYRAWDFAMLLHDARRDVSPAAHNAAVRAYLEATGAGEGDFERELAIQGGINALRILGIFSRLVARDGKQRYRTFMPREAGHLNSVMRHPRLKGLKNWVEKNAPLTAFEDAMTL